ncbi:MAG: hypothetical protein IPH42_20880 [Bacteroidetes bacterium]|nr:hypothetical protein [Bacteroidota bacterium]
MKQPMLQEILIWNLIICFAELDYCSYSLDITKGKTTLTAAYFDGTYYSLNF